MQPPVRISVVGSPVDVVDMAGAVSYAEAVIQRNSQCTIFAMNPEKAVASHENPQLRDCLSSAGLLIADGIGVIVAARLHGYKMKGRVPGAELMPKLCEMAARNGHGVFLFGAKEEVNALAADKLVEQFPALKVVGRQNGYVTEEDMPALIEKINQSGAKLLFVALGSPKQEFWMSHYKDQLQVNILQGVGGTLDVISGKVKRAPGFWRLVHLEWLYRLLSQPQRMLRQTRLPVYVWWVIKSRLGIS